MGMSYKPSRVFFEAEEVLKAIDETDLPGVTVATTDDMSPEEQKFDLTAGFLKEGYSLEVARKKAKQWINMVEEIFADDKN